MVVDGHHHWARRQQDVRGFLVSFFRVRGQEEQDGAGSDLDLPREMAENRR